MNQMMAASMQPQSHGSAPNVDQAQMWEWFFSTKHSIGAMRFVHKGRLP